MRAIVLERPTAGEAVLAEVSEPPLLAGEILCKSLAVGLCHTDVSVIRGSAAVQAGYSPSYPLTLGHEYVGQVCEVGRDVVGFQPGDRIVGSAHLSCRGCRWCLSGKSQLCRDKQLVGLDVAGALAERFVVPATFVRKVDDSIPLELAVLAEPFAVALHAVEQAQIQPGERVAVVGPGPVGLLLLGALTAEQIETTVIGLHSDAQQLHLGDELGAARTLMLDDALGAEAGAFDVVFETAGHNSAVAAAISLAGPGGRIVCVGLPNDPSEIDTADLARQEKAVIGSRAYDLSTWDRVPESLKASPRLAQLVTHKLSMVDIEQAIRLIETRKATKVLLMP